MAGIGAAVLGRLADRYGIEFVYHVCAYLPLLGVLTAFLPDLGQRSGHAGARQGTASSTRDRLG
jgi:FSR family fosmidomycin resistance protein-like MFS transporter